MANLLDKLNKGAEEVEVKGLSINWTEEGQTCIGRYEGTEDKVTAYGTQPQSLFTDPDTGEVFSVFHTLAITQGLQERNTEVGDMVLIRFLGVQGQFKRFALSVTGSDGELKEPILESEPK